MPHLAGPRPTAYSRALSCLRLVKYIRLRVFGNYRYKPCLALPNHTLPGQAGPNLTLPRLAGPCRALALLYLASAFEVLIINVTLPCPALP